MGFIGENRLKELLILIKNKFITTSDYATTEKGGIVKVDGNTVTITNGVISATAEGGTTDYADLTNKPSINNVELSGNKSLADLGIDIPTKTSDLTNDSNYVADANYKHIDKATASDLGIVKPDGTTTQVDANGVMSVIGGVGASEWADVNNKPFDSIDPNTLSSNGGVLSVIGGGSSDISSEPQNAIEEKSDGLYVFDDMWVGTMAEYLADESNIADGTNVKIKDDSTQGADISLAEYQFYSEEEQCIGCWVDGKPIYRRVITLTSQITLNANAWNTVATIPNTENCIYVGLQNTENDKRIRTVLSARFSNNVLSIVPNGQTSLYVGTNIILEYTKTTDAPNSFTPAKLSNIIGNTITDADIDEIIGGIVW